MGEKNPLPMHKSKFDSMSYTLEINAIHYDDAI